MQLTVVILLAGCLTASADVFAQKVTIVENGASLIKIFHDIKEQAGYSFIYAKEDILKATPVTIHMKNADVTDVLTACFASQPLTFTIRNHIIVVKPRPAPIPTALPPQKQISGVVTDSATKQPLAGVTIRVKNESAGAVTDPQGRFSLEVDDEAILQVTYLGYVTKEIRVAGKVEFIISLAAAATGLNQLVVVGYGTVKKQNLSGAVATVDTKKLDDRPIVNIGQALQGTVANLNVNQSNGDPDQLPAINIRGYASISGGSPLVVIDGVMSDQTQLNHLNPADIANISVLKDAASSAIYGSRAAFGVILITTKTGESEKIKVNYNNNFSFRSPTNKPKYLLNPYLYYSDWNVALGSAQFPEELMAAAKAHMADKTKPDNLYVRQLNEYMYFQTDDIFYDVYKKGAFQTNHTVDISGKTDKVNYYLSGAYQYQDGIFKWGDFAYGRYNLRSKLEIQLTPWWKLGSNTSFVANYNSASSMYYTQLKGDPSRSDRPGQMYRLTSSFFAPILDEDGHWYDFNSVFGDFVDGGHAKKHDDNLSQLFTTKVDLIKDVLSLNGLFSYSLQKVNIDYSLLSWDLYDGPGLYDGKMNLPNSANRDSRTVRHFNYDAYADFNKTFADKHYVHAIFGFNQEDYKYGRQFMSKTQLISESLPSVQLAYGTPTVTEDASSWALRSVYGRLNYIFDNKYIAEFNFRYDGSSRFPHDDRYVFNPSGSAAWIISEEKFFEPLKSVVDMVKLRGSYGQLGNQDVGAYDYIATMGVSRTSHILGGDQPMVVGTPALVAGNLTWEKVATRDFGIDVTMFKSRLDLTADVYRRDTRDMLTIGQVLPQVLGTAAPKENAANLKTRGWELSIGWRDQINNVAGKSFHYNVAFNLSDSRSFITKFSNPTRTLTSYYVGQEIGEIWGLQNDGLYTSDEEAKAGPDQTEILYSPARFPATAGSLKYADLNNDGKITLGNQTLDDHGDLKKIGNSQSHYRYGATLSANWNNFDLSVFVQGVLKARYYPTMADQIFWGKYLQPWYTHMEGHYHDRWREDNQNPNAYWPVLSHVSAATGNREMAIPQTRFLQNTAYLRLKSLIFGYSLPKTLLSKIGIERLRVYYSGENLFSFSGLYDSYTVDPENLGGFNYPLQQSNSIGLNITF